MTTYVINVTETYEVEANSAEEAEEMFFEKNVVNTDYLSVQVEEKLIYE